MSQQDLVSRYVGTLVGAAWAVLQPLATIAVFWLVFSLGFRAVGPNNIPFLVYFLPAFVGWSFFNESIMKGITSIIDQPHLIKNIVFPSEILPIVHIFSALIIHGIMIAIAIVFIHFHGYNLSLEKSPLLIYLVFAQSCLALGITWFFSALNVFHRDIGHFMTVLMNLWFWLTPIIWPMNMIPEKYHTLAAINPMLYIVEGYRWILVADYPSIVGFGPAISFWTTTLIVVLVGAFVFHRLKPEFADVL